MAVVAGYLQSSYAGGASNREVDCTTVLVECSLVSRPRLSNHRRSCLIRLWFLQQVRVLGLGVVRLFPSVT